MRWHLLASRSAGVDFLNCAHVCFRHAGISKDSVTYVAGQLDPLLRPPQRGKKLVQYGTGEEQLDSVMHMYDDLCKQLRSLKDFPLAVHSVQGTSPVFRFSEVSPELDVSSFGVGGSSLIRRNSTRGRFYHKIPMGID